MSKLILAWHLPDFEECRAFLTKMQDFCTTFFLGSPLINKYGLEKLKALKKEFSSLRFIFDSQIIDHAKINTQICIEAGAQGITVVASAPKQVMHNAALTAREYGREVYVNLADVFSLGEISLEAEQLNLSGLIIRKPDDPELHYSFIEKWETLKNNTKLPIFVLSSASPKEIKDLLSLKPDGIIVYRPNIQTDLSIEEVQVLKILTGEK